MSDERNFDDPATHRDIAALKDWIGSEFRVVNGRIDAVDKAQVLLADDRRKKDADFNDVEKRFVPREVFDAFKRSTIITVIGAVGLGLTIIGLLARGAGL